MTFFTSSNEWFDDDYLVNEIAAKKRYLYLGITFIVTIHFVKNIEMIKNKWWMIMGHFVNATYGILVLLPLRPGEVGGSFRGLKNGLKGG
jgi:hypothetical protein